jgi:hypothetical protein
LRTFGEVAGRDGITTLLPNLGERADIITRIFGGARAAQRLAIPVAVSVAIFTFLVLQLLHRVVPGTGADLRAVLRAATTARQGHDIYTPALQFLNQGNMLQILKMSTTPYVYPPPLALLTRPLTALPIHTAMAIWDALNVSMLAILFVSVIRLSRARTFKELVFVALLYGFFPLNMGLGNGQIDLTITALCLATYLLYRHGRLGTAGLVLGAIALIKPTVGIILLYFILRRAWPLVRAFAGTTLAGIGVSLVTVGPTVVWEYREVAMGWANAFGVLPLNQSIHGQLSRLFAPGLDQQATGVPGALLFVGECAFPLAAAFAAYRLLRRPEPTDLRIGILQYYAVLSLLMLGTPFTENMHLTWLLPGIGILLVSVGRERRPRPRDILAILAFFALALPLAERISWAAGSNPAGRLSSGIDCYGLIALSVVLCRSAFGSPPGLRRPIVGRQAGYPREAATRPNRTGRSTSVARDTVLIWSSPGSNNLEDLGR